MEDTPPVFQEAARCAVCSCSFSTFKRRHHCRRCGKSLCSEHSSNQIPLPQLGIKSPVRVCDDCFNTSRENLNGERVSEASAAKATDSLGRLNISDSIPLPAEEIVTAAPEAPLHECTCGMPLCICQVPTATETCNRDHAERRVKASRQAGLIETEGEGDTIATNLHWSRQLAAQGDQGGKVPRNTQVVTPVVTKKLHSASTTAGKKIPPRPAYGNELPSLFFSTTKSTTDGGSSMERKYDSTGEGMWEAIKNGDAGAVQDLLLKGVDPNYCDKQGMSLLHLAAVFNFSEITFSLMDAGARVDVKNAQGETPLDCAPATLQYKMQRKLKLGMNEH